MGGTNHITQAELKELFEYRDGHLYWLVSPNNKVKVGDRVGSINSSGYQTTKIHKKSYLVHRLIFLYHYKFLPKTVDHIDRNTLNNNIENLREATGRQQELNKDKQKGTSCKFRGVDYYKSKNNYRSRSKQRGKFYHIGYHLTEEDAATAYNLWIYNNIDSEDLKFMTYNEVEQTWPELQQLIMKPQD